MTKTKQTAFSLLVLASVLTSHTVWTEEWQPSAESGPDAIDGDEDVAEIEAYTLEELVVVGTRHAPRSVEESAAPIDVLSPVDLRAQGAVTLDDILRTLVPSFNVQRHGIDDEATLVRPVTLRGLPPDNLLVLVNGKRRHRSGVIALLGSSLNTGSQGPDLSVIPSIAIEQMELLRDGAAAQYGSDAIAGVLNLRMRDASEGALLEVRTGQYFEGDGALALTALNVGLPLTEDGFFNLSLEYKELDPTIRSGSRADAATLISRGYPVHQPAQIWGNPIIDGAWNTFFNSGIRLGSGVEAYSLGGWTKRRVEGGFFFRSPGTSTARSSVFRFGNERAVMDLDLNDDITVANVDVPSLDADFNEVEAFIEEYRGKLFLFNERFPGGFTPRFGADIRDLSLVTGLRSPSDSLLKWDASVSAARSNIDFFIFNTINASLGPDTPTSFRPRDYIQTEVAGNLDFSYSLEVGGLASLLDVAWGAEWREETFESVAGDPASYETGPFFDQGFSIGSNGYQGLDPRNAGQWYRPNYALYLDMQADVTDPFQLGVALRYEDFYRDFGSTLNGKLSAFWRVGESVSLRSTISTGFRAPSPGQANFTAVTTGFSGTGGLTEQGQVPPTHPVAAALGGLPLTEEESVNFSIGGAIELTEELHMTLDYFEISIRDRIALTGNIVITDEIDRLIREKDVLSGTGVLQEIKFFSNDFDTTTRGIDLVLQWRKEWSDQSESSIDVAYNWTQNNLDDFSQLRQVTEFLGTPLAEPIGVRLMTPRRQVELEEMNPEHRLVGSVRHQTDTWDGLLRASFFDSWKACRFQSNACTDLDSFSGDVIFDGEFGYSLGERYHLAFGIQNVFDSAPDPPPEETAGLGNSRPESTPWDYNGAFWYTRFSAEF